MSKWSEFLDISFWRKRCSELAWARQHRVTGFAFVLNYKDERKKLRKNMWKRLLVQVAEKRDWEREICTRWFRFEVSSSQHGLSQGTISGREGKFDRFLQNMIDKYIAFLNFKAMKNVDKFVDDVFFIICNILGYSNFIAWHANNCWETN